MQRAPAPYEGDVEAALVEWRRKALGVFSWASAVAYLPPIALMVAGLATPHGRLAQVILVGCYLSFTVCALLHRADYRARAWTLLAAGYTVAFIHLVTLPQGPFWRALPAMLPILAIVILGPRAGRATIGISLGFVLLGPLVQRVPGLVETFTNEPPGEPMPVGLILDQGSAFTALLVGQMVLLDRFHGFLMRSLVSHWREAGERAAAYAKLEREMQERRRLEHEVARTGDQERRRLGLDIHDGVCQQLTGALLRCEAMTRRLERGDSPELAEMAALSSLLEEAIDESHAVAKGLCPLEPGAGALAAALRTLTKRTRGNTGLPCLFSATGDVDVPDPVTAQHLYRIAQEALSNAARHAHATEIAVRLRGDADSLVLEVEDNGKGMAAGAPSEGLGLRAMAYRSHLMDGELNVTPAPNGGTRVRCRVPAGVARSDEPARNSHRLF